MKIRKPIFAFLILLILSLIMAAIIVVFDLLKSQEYGEKRNDLVAKNAVESLKILEKEMNEIVDTMNDKIVHGVELTASVLQMLSDEELISGSQIFSDGVVVHLRGEEVFYPEGFPWQFDKMDAGFIQEEPTLQFQFLRHVDGTKEEYSAVTIRPIRDDYWFIDWTSEEEYSEMLADQLSIFNVIEDLYGAFGAYLFLVDSKSPDLDIYYAPKGFEGASKVEDIGITKEGFESEVSIVSMDHKGYSASYMPLRMFGRQYTALILINSTNEFINIVINSGMVLLLVLITVSAAILWIYWVQTYVRNHELTELQKKGYHPVAIRRKARSFGLFGFLFFIIVAGALSSLSNLSLESSKNKTKLDLMQNRLATNSSMISRYQSDEESWNVYYVKRLAQLLRDFPDLSPRDVLIEAEEKLGCEYILYFDENGREIAASNTYVGLDMTQDISSFEGGLDKLLQGIPQVVLDPETDLLEGKNVQLIGTPVITRDNTVIGAVIIAIDPEKSWRAAEKSNYNSFLNIISPSGNIAVVAETETGKIIYSTEKSMVGEYTWDVGLYEKNAPDTELDSFDVLTDELWAVHHYGAYQSDDVYQYYYLTLAYIFQDNAMPFAFISAVGFLIIYWIVTAFMLRPYRSDVYNETVRLTNNNMQESLMDSTSGKDWLRLPVDDEDTADLRERWKKLLPERKASIFIQIALAVLMVIAGIRLLSGSAELTRSSIRFIMKGTWRRGFNLLSFAGLMILLVSYLVLIFFKNLLQDLVSNVFDRKAETISRLIFSFIQYASLIGLLFLAFDFLGFDTRTILASVSVLSLAVTLGAKDLVADILAGIFIILEDDFHVGDIIEVDGFSGIVQEIGARSTRLIGIGDNVKIIGNQSVKNVLNMSKMNSWYSLDLKVPADQPLKEIEAMLQLELPAIGESIPEIISGPYYKGVMSIGLNNTLYIIAECRQTNYRRVQRQLNHAILTLFQEHGYRVS